MSASAAWSARPREVVAAAHRLSGDRTLGHVDGRVGAGPGAWLPARAAHRVHAVCGSGIDRAAGGRAGPAPALRRACGARRRGHAGRRRRTGGLPLRAAQVDDPKLRVLTANLLVGRGDPEALVRLVSEQRVDVLSLQELSIRDRRRPGPGWSHRAAAVPARRGSRRRRGQRDLQPVPPPPPAAAPVRQPAGDAQGTGRDPRGSAGGGRRRACAAAGGPPCDRSLGRGPRRSARR